MVKRKFNTLPLNLDFKILPEPSLIWRLGQCVICNNTNDKFICNSCENIGFYNKISNTNLHGINTDIIVHRVYIGKNIPEHLILNILQTALILPFRTILWIDNSLLNKHYFDFKNIKNLELRNISSLLNEFIQDQKYSYLNKNIRINIKNMILSESFGIYKKVAYAIDCLRLIILQLYGGLYLDSNIKILQNNNCKKPQKLNEILPGGVKFIGRNRTQVYPAEVCVTFSELYKLQKSNSDSIKISHAECSAILGNKGAIFFDFCLFDILINYKKYIQILENKISNYSFTEKNHYDNMFNLSPNNYRSNRTPFIINSMLLSEYLCETKLDISCEKFIFKESSISIEQKEGIEFEKKAYNYIGYVTFNVFGLDFIKFYSHSHKKTIDKKVIDY